MSKLKSVLTFLSLALVLLVVLAARIGAPTLILNMNVDLDVSLSTYNTTWTESWLSGDGNPEDDGWIVTIGNYNNIDDRIDGAVYSTNAFPTEVEFTFDDVYTITEIQIQMLYKTPTQRNQGVSLYRKDFAVASDIVTTQTNKLTPITLTINQNVTTRKGDFIRATANAFSIAQGGDSQITKITVKGTGVNPFN